jgi:hypothetical protein
VNRILHIKKNKEGGGYRKWKVKDAETRHYKKQSKKQSSERLNKHQILVRTRSDNPAAATESQSEFRKSTQLIG